MSIYDKSSLVLIPSGTKAGKVYSQKPVSGDGDFTFTRSSAATRVNASGNIEKETSNLLLQSNTFDTTWAAIGINRTSGQSGYDGTNNAWKIESTNTGQSRLAQTISISGVNTISFYAKAGTANYIVPYIIGSGDPRAFFNLSTGVVGTTAYNIDASMEDVGGGWYRCSMTLERTSSSLWVFIGNTDNNFNSAIGDSIYIQDAQLEQGLVARDYIETTTAAVYGGITDNVPRLDYTDSSCPALLLEPQRTNLVTQSEYLDSWTDSGTTTTLLSTTNPSGDAQSYVIASATSATNALRYDLTFSASTDYSYSLFLKAGTSEEVRMQIYDGNTFQRLAVNPLNDFAVVDQSGINSYSIEDYGSGWYRVVMNFTTTASASSGYLQIYPDRTGNLNNVEAWGAQVEAGSYATSYIPTYGSSVTRVDDSCLATSVSDLIGQTEGTLFFECTNKALVNQARYFLLSDGGFNNRIDIYQFSEDNLGLYVATSGVVQVSVTNVALPSSGSFKFAVAYANNDYVWYLNGTQIGTDTSASVPTLTNALFALNAAGGASGGSGNSPFKQALLFKTRLTNTELADLTTL